MVGNFQYQKCPSRAAQYVSLVKEKAGQ
jgi:hypothetical protein